jgi:hypothetical protein
MALRSPAFWSVAGPFAMALMAQIGFIVHQIAFLEPAMGRSRAGLAVGVMTVMAVLGRLALGVFIAPDASPRYRSRLRPGPCSR